MPEAGKEAEEISIDRVAILDAILETAADGIITIDQEGIIESFNRSARAIFQYSQDEVIGRNISMLMSEPYKGHHDGYIGAYLETGERKIIGIGREVTAQRKDGAIFPIELAVSEVKLTGRTIFAGVIRDISDRRRAELEARQHLDEHAHAARLAALGEMVSGITHEINQPLAAIVSYAEACLRLLQQDEPDLELVSSTLSRISSQGQRAGDIVNELKEFVRKREPRITRQKLNDLILGVLSMVDHDLRRFDVRLGLNLESPSPVVEVSKIQAEQVILNLVNNAMDAMRDNDIRNLSIRTSSSTEDGAVLTMSDNGCGFQPEIAEQMFDAFYTTKEKGTGLGLSISRSIVEAHGGNLVARNDPGGGAIFCLTLPAVKQDES
jgi:two-component system sensor kinase FixL